MAQRQQGISRHEERTHDARRAECQAATEPRDDRYKQGASADEPDDIALEAPHAGEHHQVGQAEQGQRETEDDGNRVALGENWQR